MRWWPPEDVQLEGRAFPRYCMFTKMYVTILSWGCSVLGWWNHPPWSLRRGVWKFGARRSMWMTSFLASPSHWVPYRADAAPWRFSSLSSAVILTLDTKITTGRATLTRVLLSVSPAFPPNSFQFCVICLHLELWSSLYWNVIHVFQTNYFHKNVSISVWHYLSV